VRLVLLLLLLASACSIDRALVLRTKAELERMAKAGRTVEGPPPPGSAVPVPWSKGQFAVWAIRQGDYATLTSVQVEEADAEAAIVMITTLSPKLRTTARLTFSRQPHTRAEARELLTQVIRRRGNERPLTYRFHKDMHFEMRESLEPIWATLVPEPVEGPPETANVPAATMEGCRPGQGVFLYSPLGLEVRALLHPAVPINGLVTAKAKTGEVVELVEAGWSGGGPAL
jgi:hypothetical protein